MPNQKIGGHDKSSHQGNAIENVRVQFGLQQIINSSSWIGLIFTSQPDLITDSGVHFQFIQIVIIR